MSRIDIRPLLDPQMATVLTKRRELMSQGDSLGRLSPQELRETYRLERRYWNADRPELARVRNARLPGPAGRIPLRFYSPGDASHAPGVVYLHGGGWVVGDLDTHDKIMRLLALETGAVVIGVDYRLAPEHKFPVALEETVAVVRHLSRNGADWGLDPKRLAIVGDSAGANLALAASLETREEHPLHAVVLYYGVYGLKDSPSRRKFGGAEDSLSEQDLRFYAECLARGPEDLDDPRFDLLRAELSGLPPQYVLAAGLDPLLDDSLLLAELLQAAEVAHMLTIIPGVLHGFLHYSRILDAAHEAIRASAAWLRSRLDQSA